MLGDIDVGDVVVDDVDAVDTDDDVDIDVDDGVGDVGTLPPSGSVRAGAGAAGSRHSRPWPRRTRCGTGRPHCTPCTPRAGRPLEEAAAGTRPGGSQPWTLAYSRNVRA